MALPPASLSSEALGKLYTLVTYVSMFPLTPKPSFPRQDEKNNNTTICFLDGQFGQYYIFTCIENLLVKGPPKLVASTSFMPCLVCYTRKQ